MPNLILSIADLHNSVERPVIYDVMRHVMEQTRISSKTPILFLGDENKAPQQGSQTVAAPEYMPLNLWPYDERVQIEVEEDFNRAHLLSTAINKAEHPFIFLDPDLGVYVRAAYAHTEVTISVKYKARDRNQAKAWRNEMRARVSMYRQQFLHELSYHYHFPEEYIVILQEIHRLRELQAGYGEDWNTYFTKYLTPAARLMSNLSGTRVLWGIAEKQIRVQGYFDFDGIPDKAEKDSEHDSYLTTFSYKFEYEKPIECNMLYPLMVHNQLIKYRPEEKLYVLEDQPRTASFSVNSFLPFEADSKLLATKSGNGISIPSFDEFIPGQILPSTIRIFTVLCAVSPSDRRALFNLETDLDDVTLAPEILQFLKESEYPYLGLDYKSIFSLSLYEGSQLMNSGYLQVDSSLNVRCTFDLELRRTYHVRLGLVSNLALLDQAARDRLKTFPQARPPIIKVIDDGLSSNGNQPDLGKNVLTDTDLGSIGEPPRTGTDGSSGGGGTVPGISVRDPRNDKRFNTAQMLYIRARRNQDLEAQPIPQGLTP